MKKLIFLCVLGGVFFSCKKKEAPATEDPSTAPVTPSAPVSNSTTPSGAASFLLGVWTWDSVVNLSHGNVTSVYKPFRPQGVDTVSSGITYDSYTVDFTTKASGNFSNGSGVGEDYRDAYIVEKFRSSDTTRTTDCSFSWSVSYDSTKTWLKLYPFFNITPRPYTLITSYPAQYNTRIQTLTTSRLVISTDPYDTPFFGAVYYYHR